MGMRFGRIAVAAAALAVVAASGLAFEFTSWSGPVLCKSKSRVKQGDPPSYVSEATQNGVDLSTQDTDWVMDDLPGGSLPGEMAARNSRNYKAWHPNPDTAPTEHQQFLDWVKAKILAAHGLDVDLVGAELKGKFVLNADFDEVKVGHSISWYGTVATGPDAGKVVKGKIKLKGVLPRNF
jgi:hypothetical protein